AIGAKDIAAARALPADKIRDAQFSPEPCYDEELLPSGQLDLYKQHLFNDTPILVGFNSDDGAMFASGSKKPDEFTAEVRKTSGAYADRILALYPHDDKNSASRSAKELVRDVFFAWPAWYWAGLQTEHGSGKAFLYLFDYRTPHTPDGPGHAA